MSRVDALCRWLIAGLIGSAVWCALSGCAGHGSSAQRGPHHGPEAVSLLGIPLTPPTLAPETRELFERRLAIAQRRHNEQPSDEIAIIWLGRRTAYLGRYRDAIDIYSRGLVTHPESAWLLRHRGHRFLTLRRFDDAISDLRRAAELTRGMPDVIEADGLPNKQNEPKSSLNGNTWYHLGVALYCNGDLDNAADAFGECLKYSTWNDDMLVATVAWLHRTYRRLGRDGEAAALLEPIHSELDAIENHAYLQSLLFANGSLPLELALTDTGDGVTRATLAYGIAAELGARGDTDAMIEILRRIVRSKQWAAFGFIAAEADLLRLGVGLDPDTDASIDQ